MWYLYKVRIAHAKFWVVRTSKLWCKFVQWYGWVVVIIQTKTSLVFPSRSSHVNLGFPNHDCPRLVQSSWVLVLKNESSRKGEHIPRSKKIEVFCGITIKVHLEALCKWTLPTEVVTTDLRDKHILISTMTLVCLSMRPILLNIQ